LFGHEFAGQKSRRIPMAFPTTSTKKSTGTTAAAVVVATVFIATLFITAAFVGCSAIDYEGVFPASMSKSEKQQPSRMLITWTHATDKRSSKTSMRGFRGRILFYAGETSKDSAAKKDPPSDRPIKVDGMLTVYAFDETAPTKTTTGPPRKFVFSAKELKKLCHESKGVPSYAVWLPWDSIGGPPRDIRLLARFDPAQSGAVVMSENSRHLLPGVPDRMTASATPSTPKPTAKSAPASAIEQTGYETPSDSKTDNKAAVKPASGSASDDLWK
jgi:hypothetical protein